MSLFIASLGFRDPAILATAKLAILIASVIAGTAGLVLLARTSAAEPTPTAQE
jgi:Na+/H+ antiporter NhaA